MANLFSYRLASALSRNLPGGFAYWVGLRIADLFYFFQRRQREAIHANIAQVYAWRGIQSAPESMKGLVRKTFQNFGKYLVDFFRYTRLSRAELEKIIRLERLDHFESAYRQGRGVIIITAHFGNWELGGAMLHALGYPINVAVAPSQRPGLERLLNKSRTDRGLRSVNVGYSARAFIRALKRGEVVGLLADRDFSRERREDELFGKRVCLPRGAAWLALQANAPIVPAFASRQEDDRILFRFHPPLDPAQRTDQDRLMEGVRDAIQKEVGERPCQWFVFHKFWEAEPTASS